MKTKLCILAGMAVVLSLAGCRKEYPGAPPVYIPDPPQPPTPPSEVVVDKVLVMYDNINDEETRPFTVNVNDAGKAVAAGVVGADARVVVYERMASGNTVYELVRNTRAASGFEKRTVKRYAAGEHSSLSVASISAVMSYIRDELHPRATRWGFAFGSHGMGWVPASNTIPYARGEEHPFAELWAERENPTTRFFHGYGQNLDVADFVSALNRWKWDFVILDDCYMASVEALYQMRNLASYVIASPTEIAMYGFPYDRVVRSVFGNWNEAGFVTVGREFIDFYSTTDLATRSGIISVVRMAELQRLAERVRAMGLRLSELTSVEGIQYYEGLTNPAHLFYDLDDYLRRVRSGAVYTSFATQLSQTVAYAGHTETFSSAFPQPYGTNNIPITHFSGLNVFIPWSGTEPFFAEYRQTDWYKFVYVE